MEQITDSGYSFLNYIYKDLHKDKKVIKSSKKNDFPVEKIKKYMTRLYQLHQKSEQSKIAFRMLRNYYYDKYVIQEKNISMLHIMNKINSMYPDSEINDDLIEEKSKWIAKSIIDKQKNSLDQWLFYFLSEESSQYPVWFKYWSFQGMLTIKDIGKNERRTSSTIQSFCQLDKEALHMVYENMNAYLLNKNGLQTNALFQLMKNGKFSEIYRYFVNYRNSKEYELDKIEGEWVVYQKGSDHRKLMQELMGKAHDWCTINNEETAKFQLDNGDFHIYYTHDKKGELTVPRMVIRMVAQRIYEIRGILEHQNIEDSMLPILEEKLLCFPNGVKYHKTMHDMKYLQYISSKVDSDKPLNEEELRFLYQLDSPINYFGEKNDSRVKKILSQRNKMKDLEQITTKSINHK